MKNKAVWMGPLVLAAAWTVGAVVLLGQASGWTVGRPMALGLIGVGLGVVGLARLVVVGFQRWKKSLLFKVTVWSAGRPGELMVGVAHTGQRDPFREGLIFCLECLERARGGEWLLWSAESRSPTPSSEDTWPFHFTVPLEAPPTGLSPDGEVVWRLKARSVTVGQFEGEWPVVISANTGPASQLLPVPLPKNLSERGAPRRPLVIKQIKDQTLLSLPSPIAFPGPNPLVMWGVALTAFFMVMVRMKAPAWVVAGGVVLNAVAALILVAQWFGREEVRVGPALVTVRRALGPVGFGRSFDRSLVAGVRVVFSGGPSRYGVRMDRTGGLRPLAAFGGFQNHLEAHEAARSLLRCLKNNPTT